MGKTKMATYFKNIQDAGHNLFVPFITAGDGEGGVNNLPERIAFLEASGVAAIELGIPFSDPVADGPTIQAASIRSLQNGTCLKQVLHVLKLSKAKRRVPIVIMTYINPVFTYGIEAFARDCSRAGVNGIIIPDVPLEEESCLVATLQMHNIAFIRLTALTSTQERIEEIAARSEGFLYAVSVTGTTGVRDNHQAEVTDYLSTLKKLTSVPVFAGFGIANSEQARALCQYCDGVIVGSKIVDLFHKEKYNEIKRFIKESL